MTYNKPKHKPKNPPICCGHPRNKEAEEFIKLGYPSMVCTRYKGHKGAHGAWGWPWSEEKK